MTLPAELSLPLIGINDPLACFVHLAGAAWFGWQAQHLIRRAGPRRRRAAALALFALTAVAVLTISATYHGLPMENSWKPFMQRTDHAAIFLLIAGTLTSFHSICFHGSGRVWMVAVVWTVAVAALSSKLVLWSVVGDGIGLCLYLGLVAVGISSLAFLPRTMPLRSLMPLVIGGALYVGGAVTDIWSPRWLIPQVFGAHEIFHLAVVGALFLHWRFFHEWALPAVRDAAPALDVLAAPSAFAGLLPGDGSH